MVHQPLEYIVGILLLHFTLAEEYYNDDCRHCIPTIGKDSTPLPSLTSKPSFPPSLTTTPTYSPTIGPRISTALPSNPPTRSSSMDPSMRPSLLPTNGPSRRPSTVPSYSTLTKYPSMLPSSLPSSLPTNKPTDHPSLDPSSQPSNKPTDHPSLAPSSQPSHGPSNDQSYFPSNQLTDSPSHYASSKPSFTDRSSFPPSLTTTPTYSPTIGPRISTTLPSNPPTRSSSMEPSTRPSSLPTNALSRRPSTVPSYSTLTKYPSMLPSNLSSSLPTNKPTDYPSLDPSSQPSNKPTDHPSLAPSSQSSNGPSLIPSSELSDSPSLITSSQPSNNLSMIPSNHKSIVPSLDDSDLCQLSTTGFFGTISAREVLINYNYEMDYWKSYDRNEILNDLEYTISSVLVNATIPECRRSRMIQEIEQQVYLEDFVVGISSSPGDLFVDEEKCSLQQSSSSVDCRVINGTLTVYIHDTRRFLRSLSEVDSLRVVVTEIIATGMNNGDLAYSHDAIVSLRYFSVNNENRIFSSVKGVEQVEVSNEFPTYGWVLLSCTIILFLSMVGFVGRKQALKRHKDDELRVSNVNDDTFLTGDID